MLKRIKNFFLFFYCLMAVSCNSESGFHEIIDIPQISGDTDLQVTEKPQLDVLLVLDNSCSMMTDWDFINYGVAQIPEELNYYNFDWRLALISMDTSDAIFMELDNLSPSPGWNMLTLLSDFKLQAGQAEYAFDSAISAKTRNSFWFRNNVPTLVVFISDEKEQSQIEPTDFITAWHDPIIVASVVGPRFINQGESSCAESAEDFYLISHITIDICTSQRWSVIEPIVP